STDPAAAVQFLRRVAAAGRRMAGRFPPVQIMDAVVSPMEKRAGRYRAQLLVKSAARGPLHRLLDEWIAAIENHPRSRRARWSIDIDPMEMFCARRR
ncbi:MAG: primosomal protein N', partial [Gammaproteobacteria bacterium]|nr:primosomal protein N' [Gammaproteobacteria bacterium]